MLPPLKTEGGGDSGGFEAPDVEVDVDPPNESAGGEGRGLALGGIICSPVPGVPGPEVPAGVILPPIGIGRKINGE